MNTLNKTVKKKKSVTKKPSISNGKKWWASLSDKDKELYKEKKELQGIELKEQYKETSGKVDELFKNISQLTDEDLKERFANTVKFHQYSSGNNLLIHVQNRGATTVGSRKKWFSYGYKLKTDAQQIRICVPIEKILFYKKVEKSDYDLVKKNSSHMLKLQEKWGIGFKLNVSDFTQDSKGNCLCIKKKVTIGFDQKGIIYDITDVEPIVKNGVDHSKPLNDFTISSEASLQSLKDGIRKVYGYEIEEVSNEVSCGGFVLRGNTSTIYLNKYLNEATKSGALIHELAHLLLGHTEEDHMKADRFTKEYKIQYAIDEVQAETLAYLIRENLGIKCHSEVYILGYKDIAEMGDKCLQNYLNESMKIYDINRAKFKSLCS